MAIPIIARYRDIAGRGHNVVVHQTPDGHWQVLDIAGRVRVVETLTGSEDGRPQAEALARDYATHEHCRSSGQPDAIRLAA
jgi:hypothetical protein